MSMRAASRSVLISLVTCLLTATAGCTATSDHEDQTTGASSVEYAKRKCPADVAAALLGTVECGTLTVPENREENTGTVRLLVASLTPPTVTADDPIVVIGTDIATRPNYAGIGPLAALTRRRVVFLEQRGTSHSEPSLSCPQSAGAPAAVSWSDRTGSRAWLRKAERSAAQCFRRLERRGIDVASYDVKAMAADVADLITALRLAPATVVSYGSASLVAFELIRARADALRAVVLDTPDVPGVDPRGLAAGTSKRAFIQVLRWCDQDSGCRRRYPEPTTLLRRALATLARRPLAMSVSTQDGSRPVVLDPALLVRVARQSLTDGGSAGSWGLPGALPALLAAVAHRDRGQVASALSELLGTQGPMCPGYRAKCMSAHVVDEGVYNTVLCEDIAPSATLRETAAPTDEAFHRAYERSWWWRVCDHWPVAASTPAADPVRSDVHVLITVGGLAASTPEKAVRAALAGLPNASVVRVPTGSHNVLGGPCLTDLRDAWLDHPGPVPSSPRCVERRLDW